MRIVLTGAAGALGTQLRPALAALADHVVLTDIADIDDLSDSESFVRADLADLDAMLALTEGADMIVHFGAMVDEAPWDEIFAPNFLGSYNVYECAHRHGARRVVYASSIHLAGMIERTETLRLDCEHRPDTFYGLAKCFTEDLARMYWEKRGLESVCLRIYSCTEKPMNARALGTWLSYDDLRQLVTRAIDTPVTGFARVWGVSANDRAPVDNAQAAFLGYRPKDNAEGYAAEILAGTEPVDPTDPMHSRHGGPFAKVPLGESGIAMLRKLSHDAAGSGDKG